MGKRFHVILGVFILAVIFITIYFGIFTSIGMAVDSKNPTQSKDISLVKKQSIPFQKEYCLNNGEPSLMEKGYKTTFILSIGSNSYVPKLILATSSKDAICMNINSDEVKFSGKNNYDFYGIINNAKGEYVVNIYTKADSNPQLEYGYN